MYLHNAYSYKEKILLYGVYEYNKMKHLLSEVEN